MKHFLIIIFLFMAIMQPDTYSQTISLDGTWQFAADSSGRKHPSETSSLYWREITVPSSWQASFDDLREYQGIGWYRKNININSINISNIYLLKFNAVDYLSEVWVNGKNVGKHEGGFTPFSFDISPVIKDGNNEIIVRVLDPVYDDPGTEGIRYQEIPHGKQSWYVQTSGLWQSASIEIKPDLYFSLVHITPSNNGNISIRFKLNKNFSGNDSIKVNIISADKKEVFNQNIHFTGGDEFSFDVRIKDPELWSPDSPALYNLILSFGKDKFSDKFGFRKFEAKDGKFYLNDEPLYIIAALDQDFYPETIYTTPSEEYIRDEMIKAKKLGLNMLRCHIKVPDPVYLKIADELGLLVWYEVPNWENFSSDAARRGEKVMDAMVERDWNHPSLVILSIINESWGLDMSKKEQRDWLAGEYDRVKKIAPGRLVVDNSACWGNFHVKTDINDYHTYWAIPENRKNFDSTVAEMSKRPDWLFSKNGDSQETGKEPLMLSEFGNWGLPELHGQNPWWFRNDFLDNGLVLPLGYNDRFIEYRYNEVFKDYNDLAKSSQLAQYQALKYEIEQIRIHHEIQGYVITEFTDINWECNGLLDMWRNYKVYSDDILNIQQQDLIIPRPVKYNFNSGASAEIKMFLSHYSVTDLSGSILEWESSTGETGSIRIPEIGRADVKEIDPVILGLPDKSAGAVRINFTLMKDGNILSENFAEIFSYPEVDEQKELSFLLLNNKDGWGSFRTDLRNKYSEKPGPLVITNFIDQIMLEGIKDGGSIICLIDSNSVIAEELDLKIISRNSEWYDGNWASNLNWKKENEIFRNIQSRKYFGFEIDQSSPKLVIGNIPPEKFSDVLAGMYVGWIQFNSAYIMEYKYGKGKILFCTFPLAENYSTDPFARTLLDNMINYMQ
jgi:hypothetical protein